ncbi:hypothetical protein BV25DRAFT_1823579 [Artomyces pyxidatus]|uniref:Uncharacterized protein n=1 Tax=Artomyces pyxidatus TaxID=48021 RepID=A0ACB8T7F0_9AGAM|nr:hypothetical protein BV25DRAFT_1823579 [Artomyces pyxidatus]
MQFDTSVASASSSMSTAASPLVDDPSSRMRSHKGNKPSLPQTKQCPLCPAKFTRTTHLNRHLRTHTNERLHRCNICLSEFTRSDLLTRHKRSCGDLLNQNKSRRKSCQSCAESKVRCDLKQPCSKCTARGKECVFINDPATSREKKAAAAARRRASTASTASSRSTASEDSSRSISSPPSSSSTSSSETAAVFSSAFPFDMDTNTELSLMTGPEPGSSSTFDISSTDLLFQPSSDPSACPELSASSTTSSCMSPRSEIFDMATEFSYAMGPEIDILDQSLAKITPQDILQAFPPPAPYSFSAHDFSRDMAEFRFEAQPWMMDESDMPTPCARTDNMSSYVGAQAEAVPAARSIGEGASAPAPVVHVPGIPCEPMVVEAPPSKDSSLFSGGPAKAELQHYLYLFHTAFLSHMPIVHVPTWSFDGKPPILLRAMQACGALFVKTRAAAEFVSVTLENSRECLIQEVAKNPTDSDEQLYLILAGLLLQAIGLFHQSIDQRASSNIYHGMLVMMIRRCGLIGRCVRWTPPDLTGADPPKVEAAWKDWIMQEAIKRTLFLAYLHDCCHCVFFSLPPSFFIAELDWCLPVEDALWNASSSREWYDLLERPSPYGTAAARLIGQPMQKALSILGDMHMPLTSEIPPLPPFAHFILIHSILCSIYFSCFESQSVSRSQSPRLPDYTSVLYPLPLDGREGGGVKANSFVLQYTLHNWLQSWLHAPEKPNATKGVEESQFMQNAMPYYWLAQVSLTAFQEGVKLQSGTPKFCSSPEARFRVLAQWLLHIRTFLRSGQQAPTSLWGDLMRIAEEDGNSTGNSPDGLLSFFPDY